MRRSLMMPLLALCIVAAPLSHAQADRAPTAEERVQIETALRAAGYTSWGEIEFEDGKWEVDDAIGADGKKYELDLDKSYKIIKREHDD